MYFSSVDHQQLPENGLHGGRTNTKIIFLLTFIAVEFDQTV